MEKAKLISDTIKVMFVDTEMGTEVATYLMTYEQLRAVDALRSIGAFADGITYVVREEDEEPTVEDLTVPF